MIDIQFVRDNPELVKEKSEQKGYTVDVEGLLALDEQRRQLLTDVEAKRAERNTLTATMKGGKPSPKQIEQGKILKDEIQTLESQLQPIDDKYLSLLVSIPNPAEDDVPPGGEHDGQEIKKNGTGKSQAEDHLDYATARDWVDFERGAKVAGAKFYFLKGDLALLENAITQFALQVIQRHGFTLMTVPHMVNAKTAVGTGFAPRSSEQSDEYYVEGEDLSLIATSELPLTGYHADEVLDEVNLPLLYAGYSPCYRKEAGTYGKHTRGLYRVHQFNKLEMYVYSLPEKSREMHEKILKIEEEIWQQIGIPYRVVNIAAGDLGFPAAKKYDIDYWSPVDGKYLELTSCSNCTDFQARNLNIRVRRQDGTITPVHTLNGTAVSLARSLVAVIENFQKDNGKLEVPPVLRLYMNNREEI